MLAQIGIIAHEVQSTERLMDDRLTVLGRSVLSCNNRRARAKTTTKYYD